MSRTDPMSTLKFGLDRLLADAALRRPLGGRRVALLAHPASVTRRPDAFARCAGCAAEVALTAAFGPQHGLRGDKRTTWSSLTDYVDPQHGIPVFSLYGEGASADRRDDGHLRCPSSTQDLGCRIYTFITTLRYVLEAAAQHGKAVWVLDRPNPAGRPVEGLTLRTGWESFVGAGAMPMPWLTMGELAHWFITATLKLDVELRVIEMEGWQPEAA